MLKSISCNFRQCFYCSFVLLRFCLENIHECRINFRLH
jgi:hypothetical protein